MTRIFWAVWVMLALLSAAALAHNPDTSYARCVVADDAVELRLTYDVFTLLKITDLDADHDGRLTRAELRAGTPAIQQFLRAHVLMEIDGQRTNLGEALVAVWPSGTPDPIAAPDWHAASSLIVFPFRHRVSKPPRDVALTFTLFPQLGAQHTVLGVFERRGLTKTDEITFTEGEPDYLFDASFSPQPAGKKETVPAAVSRFLQLGIGHIFLGYDHICFLLALVVVGRLGEMVKVITSFTLAHSITLILAAQKIIPLPPQRLIECGVAATIVYVAIENLVRKNVTHRWVVTFFFGLIHGFSFANVLANLGLPREATIRCLLSFNVGVEIGQLIIVLVALPVLLIVSKQAYGRQVKAAISLAVALFGLGWFIERTFGLGFMPI